MINELSIMRLRALLKDSTYNSECYLSYVTVQTKDLKELLKAYDVLKQREAILQRIEDQQGISYSTEF